jgi:hypothetical protein
LERALRTDLSEMLQEEYPLTNLGHLLAASGTPERAIPLFERALQEEEVHKTDPDATAETRFALASASGRRAGTGDAP